MANIWTVGTKEWFQENGKSFCFAGGDICTLISNAQLRSSQRSFGLHPLLKNRILQQDLTLGLQDLLKNRVTTKKEDEEKEKEKKNLKLKRKKEKEEAYKYMYI